MESLSSARQLFWDAGRFLFRLDPFRRLARFLHLTPDAFTRSVFLDDRIAVENRRLLAISLDDLLHAREALAPPLPPTGFLFHTAFCCSTLLARAVQALPGTHVLREPLALRDLADARRSARAVGAPDPLDAGVGRLALGLLTKTFEPGQTVVIKPTNLAANLAEDMLRLAPHARGVVLSCSYDDWMVSCLKKLPETRAKMPWLAAQFLRDDPAVAESLNVDPGALDELRAMALVWYLQRRDWAARLVADGGAKLRSLDAAELLAQPAAVLEQVRRHLGLAGAQGRVAEVVAGSVWHTHAKDPRAEYDATRRAAEAAAIRERHRNALARARVFHDWLQAGEPVTAVLPHPLVVPGTAEDPAPESRRCA